MKSVKEKINEAIVKHNIKNINNTKYKNPLDNIVNLDKPDKDGTEIIYFYLSDNGIFDNARNIQFFKKIDWKVIIVDNVYTLAFDCIVNRGAAKNVKYEDYLCKFYLNEIKLETRIKFTPNSAFNNVIDKIAKVFKMQINQDRNKLVPEK